MLLTALPRTRTLLFMNVHWTWDLGPGAWDCGICGLESSYEYGGCHKERIAAIGLEGGDLIIDGSREMSGEKAILKEGKNLEHGQRSVFLREFLVQKSFVAVGTSKGVFDQDFFRGDSSLIFRGDRRKLLLF